MVVLDALVELEFLMDTSEKYLIDNIAKMEQRLEEQKKMNDVKDIRESINRLIQVADLLEVADTASESLYINTKIKEMTVKFQKLIGEIRSELKVFRMQSHYALTKHATAAELLFASEADLPEEEIYEMLPVAIADIQSCIDIAQELSKKAEYISDEACSLRTDSLETMEDVYKGRENTNQVAIEEQKKIEEKEKLKLLATIATASSTTDNFWRGQAWKCKLQLEDMGLSLRKRMEKFQATRRTIMKKMVIRNLKESGYTWLSYWHMYYYALKEIEEPYNKVTRSEFYNKCKLDELTNTLTILGGRIQNDMSDSNMVQLYEDTLETVQAIEVTLKAQIDAMERRHGKLKEAMIAMQLEKNEFMNSLDKDKKDHDDLVAKEKGLETRVSCIETDLRDMKSSIEELKRRAEEGEKKRWDWVWSMLPAGNIVMAARDGDPWHLLPGYDAVQGIGSLVKQDVETLYSYKNDKEKEHEKKKQELSERKEEVRKNMIRIQSLENDEKRLQTEIDEKGTEINRTARQITLVGEAKGKVTFICGQEDLIKLELDELKQWIQENRKKFKAKFEKIFTSTVAAITME